MKSLIVFFLSILLVIVVPLNIVAQIEEPIVFSTQVEHTSPDELTVLFKGKINHGWHIYSSDIPSGGPVCSSFISEGLQGAEFVGSLFSIETPIEQYDEMFGMKVKYHEGKVTFCQRFKLTASSYSLKGYLEYGACNDQSCLPPMRVPFQYSGNDGPQSLASVHTESSQIAIADETPSSSSDTLSPFPMEKWWQPVISQMQDFEKQTPVSRGLLLLFALGFLGGLLALFTPCVWPVIPMTVSFFIHRSSTHRRALRESLLYGFSIVSIYLIMGIAITLLFGASALNSLSTNAVMNLFFFALLVIFGLSFLGGFEITLPSSWTRFADNKAEQASGLVSIFFMAFTLVLVSFSCTGPIIGFLLVEVGSHGEILAPAIGMFGFAFALALPFSIFAFVPSAMNKLPKSGSWMNSVKVVLGFLELAFSLKFLSVADLAYGWHLLNRETFLSLWIVLFFLLGFYLLGKIRFPGDSPSTHTSITRFCLSLPSLAFAVYLLPGLWGAPVSIVSAFAPPMDSQSFSIDKQHIEAHFTDFDEGMRYARKQGKPALVDFTGYGCVNCRKMEALVWNHPSVAPLLKEKYVLISLYVDDKKPLSQPCRVVENGKEITLTTIGERWSYLQRTKFGANAQPFYVILDSEGQPLAPSFGFTEKPEAFARYLEKAYSSKFENR